MVLDWAKTNYKLHYAFSVQHNNNDLDLKIRQFLLITLDICLTQANMVLDWAKTN